MKGLGLTLFTAAALLAVPAHAETYQLPDMRVTSAAFSDGGIIPIRYTSHGQNIQPDFTITGAPAATKSYVVVMRDIDVAMDRTTQDVLHWLAFDIPSTKIPAGHLPASSVTGANFLGKATFIGSGAPLRDRYHHYLWEFYALDGFLRLKEGASIDAVFKAMQGKVLAKAAYVGRYANASPQ